MDRIFICIFLLAVLPYAGIPNQHDMWIVIVVAALLVHSVYRFTKKNNLFSTEVEDEPEKSEEQ